MVPISSCGWAPTRPGSWTASRRGSAARSGLTDMKYIDFAAKRKSDSIDLLFPGWSAGESVVVLSPHDDDAALGAGYLIQAVLRSKGRPHVIILCRGDAGYSTPEEKDDIVDRRREESEKAYALLGVPPEDVHHFGFPDLSLMGFVDREVPGGRPGALEGLLKLLRRIKAGRVAFTSPHFENWDHTAAFDLGMYGVPQAGDPILADLGAPHPVRSLLIYSVWGDFEPRWRSLGPAADAGILAPGDAEDAVRAALGAFASQARIMAGTVAAARDRRRSPQGWLELYQRREVRRPIDYGPYFDALKKLR